MQKVLDPRFSHFVAPLPVINDQSLSKLSTLNAFVRSHSLCSRPNKRTQGRIVWFEFSFGVIMLYSENVYSGLFVSIQRAHESMLKAFSL